METTVRRAISGIGGEVYHLGKSCNMALIELIHVITNTSKIED